MFNLFGKKPAKADPNSIFVNLNAKHIPLSTTMVNLYVTEIRYRRIVFFNSEISYTITDEAFENLCSKWGAYLDDDVPNVSSILPETSVYHIPSAFLYKCRLVDVHDIKEYLTLHDLGKNKEPQEYASGLFLYERLDGLEELLGDLDEQLDSGTIEIKEADRRIKAIKKEYKKIKKEIKKNECYND